MTMKTDLYYKKLQKILPVSNEDFKLEKGPTDKAKEPDPGGSDQKNCSFPEEVRPCLTKYWKYNSSIQPYHQFFCFSVFLIPVTTNRVHWVYHLTSF